MPRGSSAPERRAATHRSAPLRGRTRAHGWQVVAPLTTLFAWLYFLPCHPLHAQLLLRVLGRPAVDSKGAVWEEAVAYQTAGLVLSQVLLLGVTLLKRSVQGSVLALLALVLTVARSAQMVGHAARGHHVPLHRCAQLDRADGGAPAFADLGAYEAAAARVRRTLLEGLEGGIGHGIDLVAHLATHRPAGLVQPLIGAGPGGTRSRASSRS